MCSFPAAVTNSTVRSWLNPFQIWLLSVLAAVVASAFGIAFISSRTASLSLRNVLDSMGSFDSMFYSQILEHGYCQPEIFNRNVVFFPVYPVTARVVHQVTAASSALSLLIVAWTAYAVALLVFYRYALLRSGGDHERALWCSVVLGAYPTSVFFVTQHTEALFLCEVVSTLYLLAQGRRTLAVVVIGLATATRSVGIALLLPWIVAEWTAAPVICAFVARVVVLAPLALSGLFAYMVYLGFHIGDAWAFASGMPKWLNRPNLTGFQQVQALLTLEPLWAPYVPTSSAFWMRHDSGTYFLFSMQFANPIFFVLAIWLHAYGALRGWLNRHELSLSLGLLGIPYLLQSYGSAMQSHGRYAAVAFPMYLVMERLLRSKWSVGIGGSSFAAGFVVFGVTTSSVYLALMAAGFKVV